MNRDFESDDDVLNAFDLEKFVRIVKRSAIYILLFFVVSIAVAYLVFIRWSKPVYQSESLLKLDVQSEATSLGLSSLGDISIPGLSGEIEILKSDLFLSLVVDAVDMDVSYFFYGNFLEDERYHNSPFIVSHKLKDHVLYDKPMDVTIIDNESFLLSYQQGGGLYSEKHQFGEEISNDRYNLFIEKTSNFEPGTTGNYYFVINSRGKLINYLRANLNVLPENFNAKTLRLTFTDYSKYKAKNLLQAIDTLYLDYTRDAKNKVVEQKIEFLEEQISLREDNLYGYESYFENFIIDNRTQNLNGDISKTIGLLNALDSQELTLKRRLVDAEFLAENMDMDSSLLSSELYGLELSGRLMAALSVFQKIKRERERLLMSYNENTFVVKRLDLQYDINEERVATIIGEYKESLKESLLKLRERRTKIEEKFFQLPSMNTEYGKNRRFYSLEESFQLSLRSSKMDLEITRAGTVTNFIILSPATLPLDPIKPEIPIIYAIASALAAVVSFLFLLIRYFLNNNISSVKELEKLINVPLLGTLPFYSNEKLAVTKLVISPSSKSAISESLRTIRTNMEFLSGANQNKVMTITSTVSGEGKTFVSVNLAAIIAFSEQKVCIVDLDMRKPKVHLAFGDDAGINGVSTHLIGKCTLEECIRKTRVETLDYIPAGPNPPNPSELMLHKQYKVMIDNLKQKYDMVILDTPPVGLVTDAVLSMKNSDIQVYVMRSEYSKREYVKAIESLRKRNQFSNLTVVFNSVKKGDGSYAGHGNGYGYGYYEE